MKKTLLIACVMVCALCASAQVTIIPKAGFTLSKIAFDDTEGMKPKIGLNLGVGANMVLSDVFSVQPELQFIQKGYAFKESESSFGIKAEYKERVSINYLEIPLLFKASFGSDDLKFFLNAGPSIGFGLGGKGKVEFSLSGQDMNESDDEEFKVRFGDIDESNEEVTYFDNRIDVGIQLGGGILIANKVVIDIRYGLGMSNLVDEQGNLTAEDVKSKNRVFQFTVGMPLMIN